MAGVSCREPRPPDLWRESRRATGGRPPDFRGSPGAARVCSDQRVFWHSGRSDPIHRSVWKCRIPRTSLGGGQRTLGWSAAAPAARAPEGRLKTVKTIHPPLITSTTAPNGTVNGVLAGPIV